MPTYQYACTACGHQLEAVQSFTDDPLTDCPECAGRLRKRFNSVGIVFKGSGFYRTDSRAAAAAGKGPAGRDSDGKGSDGKGSDSKTSAGTGGGEAGSGSGSGGTGSGSGGTGSGNGSGGGAKPAGTGNSATGKVSAGTGT